MKHIEEKRTNVFFASNGMVQQFATSWWRSPRRTNSKNSCRAQSFGTPLDGFNLTRSTISRHDKDEGGKEHILWYHTCGSVLPVQIASIETPLIVILDPPASSDHVPHSLLSLLSALHEGLHRSIGGGYRQTSATLHPHPVLVRQNRACNEEILINGSSIRSKWPKQIIYL